MSDVIFYFTLFNLDFTLSLFIIAFILFITDQPIYSDNRVPSNYRKTTYCVLN
ncbi:hypothetical protein XBFFL1_1650002 [Xenorhabdus bovienii str. feltiae Florida]|nr:hypothetical protein XBFFR1_420002 [Xenorhabdus bovienii str. feltiae France]CDG91570.1 hypothetical protein XBFFL1_1650002 [Xenorhabdus bovienii str. feltiae Florida]